MLSMAGSTALSEGCSLALTPLGFSKLPQHPPSHRCQVISAGDLTRALLRQNNADVPFCNGKRSYKMRNLIKRRNCSCILNCALCLFSCYWVPIENSLAPFYYSLPTRCLYTWIRSPRTLSSPGWTLPAPESCSSPIIVFVALCWTRSSLPISFLHWDLALDIALRWVWQQGGRTSSLQQLAKLLPADLRMLLAFLTLVLSTSVAIL